MYQLALDEASPLLYKYDDQIREISKKTFYVEVAAGNRSVVLAKDYYYSHHGLMIETPPELATFNWSENAAYTLKDAAEFNVDLLDHWLAMNLAKNIDEFQQAFKEFDGIPWVNTVYADDKGNAFYIDKSRVLNLSDTALAALRSSPQLEQVKNQLGFYVLPGDTSLFEPNGLNSYEQAPKLLRTDYVQNSNDSYWATNPSEPLSGYSLLYGKDFSPLSMRTRMSLKMLNELATKEGYINDEDVKASLLSNRSYVAELVLEDLITHCLAQQDNLIELANAQVDIKASCAALRGV